MKRKRVWVSLAAALALYVGLNAAVVAAEPRLLQIVNADRMWSSAQLGPYLLGKPADIVWMGNSRAADAFLPTLAGDLIARETGRQTSGYNLAITGADITMNYLILKNYLTGTHQPKVIVYGLTEVDLDGARGLASGSALPWRSVLERPDDFAAYSGSTLTEQLRFIGNQICPICRDSNLIRTALNISFNPRDALHQPYTSGLSASFIPADGHHPVPQDLQLGPDAWQVAHNQYRTVWNNWTLDGPEVGLMRDFLALAKERGIKVVLVNLPTSDDARQAWGNPDKIDAYIAEARRLANEQGATLVEWYRDPERMVPLSDYLDGHHLNGNGAVIVTQNVTERVLVPMFRSASP